MLAVSSAMGGNSLVAGVLAEITRGFYLMCVRSVHACVYMCACMRVCMYVCL